MEWYYIIGTIFAGILVLGLVIKGVVYIITKLSHKVEYKEFKSTKDDLYDKFNGIKDSVADIDKKEAVIQEKVSNIESTQGEMKTTLGNIWKHLKEKEAHA